VVEALTAQRARRSSPHLRYRWHRSDSPKPPARATPPNRSSCRHEGRQLFACGGDGTLNEVVNGSPASKTVIRTARAPSRRHRNILAKELTLHWTSHKLRNVSCADCREIALGLATP